MCTQCNGTDSHPPPLRDGANISISRTMTMTIHHMPERSLANLVKGNDLSDSVDEVNSAIMCSFAKCDLIQFTTTLVQILGLLQMDKTRNKDVLNHSATAGLDLLLMCCSKTRKKGLRFTTCGVSLDTIYGQLFHFTLHRIRPGLVPQGIQGLQANAKGTIPCVPQPQPQ